MPKPMKQESTIEMAIRLGAKRITLPDGTVLTIKRPTVNATIH